MPRGTLTFARIARLSENLADKLFFSDGMRNPNLIEEVLSNADTPQQPHRHRANMRR